VEGAAENGVILELRFRRSGGGAPGQRPVAHPTERTPSTWPTPHLPTWDHGTGHLPPQVEAHFLKTPV